MRTQNEGVPLKIIVFAARAWKDMLKNNRYIESWMQ